MRKQPPQSAQPARRKKIARLLSLLLAAILAFGGFPADALAEELNGPAGSTPTTPQPTSNSDEIIQQEPIDAVPDVVEPPSSVENNADPADEPTSSTNPSADDPQRSADPATNNDLIDTPSTETPAEVTVPNQEPEDAASEQAPALNESNKELLEQNVENVSAKEPAIGVSLSAQGNSFAGDTPSAAYEISISGNTSYYDHMEYQGDSDWFMFRIPSAGIFKFNILSYDISKMNVALYKGQYNANNQQG